MMSHEYHDRVSMELARRIASELPRRKEWLDLAAANLKRWRMINADTTSLLRSYDEWEQLLHRPVPVVCAVLTADTDEGQRLRQNSPFAGAISHRAVWEIKRRVRDEAKSP
jgi:hypothetical protein